MESNNVVNPAFVSAFFICVAHFVYRASVDGARVSAKRSGVDTAAIGVIGGYYSAKLVLSFLALSSVPLIVGIAFGALGFAIAIMLVAILVASPVVLLTHISFKAVETIREAVMVAAIHIAVFAVAAYAWNWYDNYQITKKLEHHARVEARKQERKERDALIVRSRSDAIRKQIPLNAIAEPYASALKCVEPLMKKSEDVFRQERRWPLMTGDAAGVAAAASCRIETAGSELGGKFRVAVFDPSPPPGEAKRERMPGDPPPLTPGVIRLYLVPHVKDDGTVLWLCASPRVSWIQTRVQGCGDWDPDASPVNESSRARK
jgi:hypothetical protein